MNAETLKRNGKDVPQETPLWEWFRHLQQTPFHHLHVGQNWARATNRAGRQQARGGFKPQQRSSGFGEKCSAHATKYLIQSKLCLRWCRWHLQPMCWAVKMSCQFKKEPTKRYKNSAWGLGHADYYPDADWLAPVLASSVPFTNPASLTDHHNSILHNVI